MKKAWFLVLLTAYLLSLTAIFSGCIRLTGGAGVWKQGAEDEAPVSHEIGFDTQDIIPQKSHANITK